MPDSHAVKDELIRRLDLKPHPEGGFFSETYRSAERVIRDSDHGDLLPALRRRAFGVAPDQVRRGLAFLCGRTVERPCARRDGRIGDT
jgi:hypothetical protein